MEKNYYRFYSEVGNSYPEEDIVYNTLRGKLRRRFVCEFLDRWHGSLLDIGCNRGMYGAYYNGGTVLGVDISKHALAFALKRPKRGAHQFHAVLGDAENLKFIKPCSFDNVLCSEVLEHVYNPEEVMNGIADVLRHGGTALITVPNYSGKRPMWESTGILRKYDINGPQGDTYYHTAFKPDELASLAGKCGLEIVEKGTLEKEVKYATKIPVLVYFFFDVLNKTLFRSRRFGELNNILLDRFSQLIYRTARILRIDSLLKALVREGVRSYVIVRKPQR
ncbi:class I SAM-dependent methyltransferase [candidate division KSB1 bacterium]